MYPYEIIDEIVPFCPGWHRNAGGKNLLRLIEKAVNEYYSDVSWIFRDNSNEGKVPYLLTTDNNFNYDIVAANLSCGAIEKIIDGTSFTLQPKMVKRIFIDITRSITDYQLGLKRRGEEFEENGHWYIAVPFNSEPGSDGTPPLVRFMDNPGTTTDKFLIDFNVMCPKLTAETIPIPINEEFREGIVEFCIGTCQKLENGRGSELLLSFEENWKPRFRRFMRGASSSSQSNKTKVRLC